MPYCPILSSPRGGFAESCLEGFLIFLIWLIWPNGQLSSYDIADCHRLLWTASIAHGLVVDTSDIICTLCIGIAPACHPFWLCGTHAHFFVGTFVTGTCLVWSFAKDCAWLYKIALDMKNMGLSIVNKVNYKKMMHFPPKVLIWCCLSHIMVFVDCIL